MEFNFLEQKDQLQEGRRDIPKKLYRGMRHKNMTCFDPKKNKKKRGLSEESLVFATPDKAFATLFLVPEADDSWTFKHKYGDVWVNVISDQDLYKTLDVGGSVYEIDECSDFYCNETGSLKRDEWTSSKIIQPSAQKEYDCGFNAMIENGVQVYFTDENTFIDIVTAEDYGRSILCGLMSENEKIGKNIKQIPKSEQYRDVEVDYSYAKRQLENFYVEYYIKTIQNFLKTLSVNLQQKIVTEINQNRKIFENAMSAPEYIIPHNIFSEDVKKFWKLFKMI